MKIKPCPFCDGDAQESGAGNYAKCSDMDCVLGRPDSWMEKEAWNTRTDDKRINILEAQIASGVIITQRKTGLVTENLELKAQLEKVLNAEIRTDWTGSKVKDLDTVQAILENEDE